MKFNQIVEGIEFISNIDPSTLDSVRDVEDIVYDSRLARENTIFVAIKGETVDGHDFIEDAHKKGCRIFVVEDNIKMDTDCLKIIVEDSRKTLSKMSSNFFKNPSSKLKVVGVTGTKGKTTITNFIKTVFCESGLNTGVIGTNGIFYNDKKFDTINTTPESYEIHKTMAKMVDDGVKCVAMEVSSSGLMMDRVDDIEFDIGIFTNLSHDHIGPKEHPDFENYRECKSRLFKLCKHSIINVDDEHSGYMIGAATGDVVTFSVDKEGYFKAEDIRLTRNEKSLGADFVCVKDKKENFNVHISSPGKFSIYNSLAVLACCDYLGLDRKRVLDSLSNAKVDGRVEVLSVLPYATVVLDYAHNGISLENVLNTMLKYKPNRLICLFGSIGGRAIIRRKDLGDVAARLCDVAVLTSDNPDFENPKKIIDDISESFVDSKCEVIKIVDRAEAIFKALEIAKEGDMVVIAGKGHEKYQYIEGKRVFFDEKAEVFKAAEKLLKAR